MEVIAIINQKGGVGKTTTAVNISAGLAREGYAVLLIDCDPQGNASQSVRREPTDEEPTLYEVLKGNANIDDAIKTVKEGLDLLPTDIRLSAAELELASVPARELLLKEALAELKTAYDFVIIDCAPSLSLVTLEALVACNSIIIPVQAAYLPLKGIKQLLDTVELVKKRLNTGLDLLGVVVTMYNSSRNLDGAMLENVRSAFPGKLLAMIPNNIALAEAQALGQDIYTYAPLSRGALVYMELTKEIIKRSFNNG